MAKALTAPAIAKLQPDPTKRLEIGDGICPGLRLLITPAGAKSYVVRFKLHGRAGKLTLGPVDRMSLSEARDRARDAMAAVSRGENPAEAKKAQREAQRLALDADRDLWTSVLNEFEQRHASKLRSGAEMMRFLRRETSGWDRRPISEIARKDVIRLLDAIVDSGRPSTAVKIKLHLSKVFGWAVGRDLLPVSPIVGVPMPAVETARDRVLTQSELRLVWLSAGRLHAPFRQYVQTLILTGQRREEVASLPWSELQNLDGERPEWHLPAARAKNKRASILPVSAFLKEVLSSTPKVTSDSGLVWVFTSDGRAPISGYSALKAKLDKEIATLILEGHGGKEVEKPFFWRFHDLRRTSATRMADLGVAPHVIEVILNHVGGSRAGVAGTYNRSRYHDQVCDALDLWACHLREIVGSI